MSRGLAGECFGIQWGSRPANQRTSRRKPSLPSARVRPNRIW